jgi:hypothetical protein
MVVAIFKGLILGAIALIAIDWFIKKDYPAILEDFYDGLFDKIQSWIPQRSDSDYPQ